MAIVSPQGQWLKVNRALCEITGYTEEELLSTTFQAITHPDDLSADLCFVAKMLKGEIRTYQMENRYLHKDGSVVHILLSVSLVRFLSGSPKYFISQIQDITASVLAQLQLKHTHQRLDKALREVRELRGVLPICSYCKQVRNDRQYWQTLEAY